jgi:uncharacterized protein DUF2341/concanavalin A-like lectin/glucanase superfamily protein
MRKILSFIVSFLLFQQVTIAQIHFFMAAANPAIVHWRSITIPTSNVTGSTQTNYPMLFSGTYSYLATKANGGEVSNASGYDITFSSNSSGTSLLSWEIESYNATTGAIVAWVNIPSLSVSSNTIIYLRYGSTTISSFQGGSAGAVWDANYVGVYHMNQVLTAPGQSETDYTTNGNNYVASGTWSSGQSITGKIGQGLQAVNANSDYLAWSGVGLNGFSSDFTVEGWFNISSASNTSFTFGATNLSNDCNWFGGDYRLYNGSDAIVDGTATPTSTWVHLVVTRVGNALAIYHNGAATTGTQGSAFTYNFQTIFNNNGTISSTIECDEVRLSSIGRSANWVSDEYLNESAPSSFYTIGAEN